MSACLFALAPFEGFRLINPCHNGRIEACYHVVDFGRVGAEELTAHVDKVDSLIGKLPVKMVFQTLCVITKDHRMYVVAERHRCIA